MSKESNRIPDKISCLNVKKIPATLISTQGAHCDVWQISGPRESPSDTPNDIVVKRHTLSCSIMEGRIYHKDYTRLKQNLFEIIPNALFVRTMIDGEDNILVIARAHVPWFNIANPVFEQEAVPLLQQLPKAWRQLSDFVTYAQFLYRTEQKVIDLWGLDNLVLDTDREIRYLDSFEVFFHEDLLHLIDNPGDDLKEKIDVSLRRLAYLEHLIEIGKPQDSSASSEEEKVMQENVVEGESSPS